MKPKVADPPNISGARHDGPPPRSVRVLFMGDVIERTRLSRASIYRHSARGLLPRLHHLGKRSFMYESELDAALLALGDASQKAA